MTKKVKRTIGILCLLYLAEYLAIWILGLDAEVHWREVLNFGTTKQDMVLRGIEHICRAALLAFLIPYDFIWQILKEIGNRLASRPKIKCLLIFLIFPVIAFAPCVITGGVCRFRMPYRLTQYVMPMTLCLVWLFAAVLLSTINKKGIIRWCEQIFLAGMACCCLWLYSERFSMACVFFAAALLFLIVYDLICAREHMVSKILLIGVLGSSLLWTNMILTNHAIRFSQWMDKSPAYVNYSINGPFSMDMNYRPKNIDLHFFTGINMYYGTGRLLLIAGILAVQLVTIIILCRNILKYSKRRAGMVLGIYLFYGVLLGYIALSDMGLVPELYSKIFYNYYEFVPIFVMFRLAMPRKIKFAEKILTGFRAFLDKKGPGKHSSESFKRRIFGLDGFYDEEDFYDEDDEENTYELQSDKRSSFFDRFFEYMTFEAKDDEDDSDEYEEQEALIRANTMRYMRNKLYTQKVRLAELTEKVDDLETRIVKLEENRSTQE